MSYTREQIQKARQLADHAFDEGKEDRKYHPGERHPGETWIDTFTEALGLDVEDEKPEPGTIGITCDGLAAYVDGGGVWRVILANGDWRNANDADAITPARVVSEDEWAELSAIAESRSRVIHELRQSRDKWAELARKAEQEAKAVARRKMGAKAEVTRAQVMDAYTDGTLAVSHADTRAIDRIMELLAASK